MKQLHETQFFGSTTFFRMFFVGLIFSISACFAGKEAGKSPLDKRVVGKYKWEIYSGAAYSMLEIKKGGRFSYSRGVDTDWIMSYEGDWRKENDFLILNGDIQPFQVVKGDSMMFRVYFKEMGYEAIGAEFTFYGNNGEKKVLESNYLGEVDSREVGFEYLYVEVYYTGCSRVRISADEAQGGTIEIPLIEGNYEFIRNEKWEIKNLKLIREKMKGSKRYGYKRVPD